MRRTPNRSSADPKNKGNVTLSDPDRKINSPIVPDQAFYPNGATNVPVDATITAGRLLTGIQSPSNPLLGGQAANLPNSRGFEGMAIIAYRVGW